MNSPAHPPLAASVLPENYETLLPSEEDISFFRQHGYYLSKKILSAGDIDAAIESSERFYRGEVRSCSLPLSDRSYPKGDFGEKLRKHDFASFLAPEGLANLVRKPLIGAIAARLVGASAIRLWHDQLLYKPGQKEGEPVSQSANLGWHTDLGYWRNCSSNRMITAWIPFHDCDEAMGSITMIDGSHLWSGNLEGLDAFEKDLDLLERKFVTGGKSVRKVVMNMQKGQVSFHHCLTIHGSGPNRSPHPRRSIAVHLQDDANCYREHHRKDGSLASHPLDRLVRTIDSLPDYSDPVVCPTLFSTSDSEARC